MIPCRNCRNTPAHQADLCWECLVASFEEQGRRILAELEAPSREDLAYVEESLGAEPGTLVQQNRIDRAAELRIF